MKVVESLVIGAAAMSSTTTTPPEKPVDIPVATCESYGLPVANQERYHGDQVCDRVQYNNFKSSLNRHLKYKEMKETQSINAVPNQKTVVCPLEVGDLKHETIQQGTGYDTIWIVENTSSEPVVLSFIKEGVEYSAVNPKISPPHSDPEAILTPGKWKAIAAFDGHVFHARTFDPKTNMLGPVVLQHRTGLIPVGSKFQDLECPADDPEPIVPETKEIDPKFARTKPAVHRPCNTIDIGFRNMANCPLHGYYISSNDEMCQEKFKFHLGMNTAAQDFMWGWDSTTKFEGSFVGHSFAFRSAADPSILVETVTLQPTQVIDCPELKEKVQVNTVTTVGEMLETMVPITDEGEVGRQDQLEDTMARMDRQLMASLFNETNATNATSGRPRRGRLDPNLFVGFNSF